MAVGPVHAGIIEPGHFRFQCHGEQVFHLEISLGYQHRGVERHLVGGPTSAPSTTWRRSPATRRSATRPPTARPSRPWPGCHVPARAQCIRGIALELERLANHTGDLGALAGDVGFLPTASYCGRIRGDFLNLTAAPVRQPVRPRTGPPRRRRASTSTERCKEQPSEAAGGRGAGRRRVPSNLLWDSASVHGAVRGTGSGSSEEVCAGARAGRPGGPGLRPRARRPPRLSRGHLPLRPCPVSHLDDGRCLRPGLRPLAGDPALGARSSASSCRSCPDGRDPGERARPDARAPRGVARRGLARGDLPRGVTDAAGPVRPLQDRRPLLPQLDGAGAWRCADQQISDFPLCNKSFNLSYCGHDL